MAYACGPDAQASQRVPRLELISAHASMTPAHTMPAVPFICFYSSCGLPRKGSEAVSVVVGAHGAGRAHTDYVCDCCLVPGLGGSLCGLGCGVVFSFLVPAIFDRSGFLEMARSTQQISKMMVVIAALVMLESGAGAYDDDELMHAVEVENLTDFLLSCVCVGVRM